jgi:hypothetical protein
VTQTRDYSRVWGKEGIRKDRACLQEASMLRLHGWLVIVPRSVKHENTKEKYFSQVSTSNREFERKRERERGEEKCVCVAYLIST